ncbi:hypothetical protein ACJX0J_011884 [Zea mays]
MHPLSKNFYRYIIRSSIRMGVPHAWRHYLGFWALGSKWMDGGNVILSGMKNPNITAISSLADSICANRLENEAAVNIRGLSDLAKYRYISDATGKQDIKGSPFDD